MSKHLKSTLKLLFFLSIGVAMVFLFYYKMAPDDREAFWEAIKRANYGWLLASIGLGLFSHFVRAARWGDLLQGIGYKARFPNLFFAVMNMYFFNLAVPRLGEFTRCTLLYKYEKVPFEKAFGTVLAERAVDLICLLLVMGGTILWMLPEFKEMLALLGKDDSEPSSSGIPWMVWAALFLLAVGLLLWFLRKRVAPVATLWNKLRSLFAGILIGLRAVLKLPHPGRFLLQTLLIWLCYFFMTQVCFYALPETQSLGIKAPLAIVAFASLAILFIPGGVGAFPLMVSGMLVVPGLGGIEPSLGWAIGWIIWSAQTLMILSVGLLTLIFTPLFNQKFPLTNDTANA
jgi:glycosyltransferase 2 family protein